MISTAQAAATGYTGVFRGRPDQVSRARHAIARHLAGHPAAADAALINRELAANAVLHSRSAGQFFTVRAKLSEASLRLEVEDLGGPWNPGPRRQAARPGPDHRRTRHLRNHRPPCLPRTRPPRPHPPRPRPRLLPRDPAMTAPPDLGPWLRQQREPDRFGDPEYDRAQDIPRVIITISLPEGTDAQLRLTSLDTPPGRGSRGASDR